MPARASGSSIRDVLLNFTVKDDPGNAERIRRQGQRAKKTEEDGQEAARRAEEERDRISARYHIARMSRERQYAAELRKNEAEQLRAGAALARQMDQQIKDAERDQLRWGAREARRIDQQIKDEAAQRERSMQEQRRRLAQQGSDRAIGGRQALMGGFQLARGLTEFGIANLSGDDSETRRLEKLAQRLIAVQGVFDSLAGGTQMLGGLGRMGAFNGMSRMASRTASRLLVGASSAASGLGLELGATGGSSLAAAGSVALPALAAAASTAIVGRETYEMLFKKPQDRTTVNTIGRFEAAMMRPIAGMMPDFVSNLTPRWTPFGASIDDARSGYRLTQAQDRQGRRSSAAAAMYQSQEENFAYENRIAGFRDSQLALSRSIAASRATAGLNGFGANREERRLTAGFIGQTRGEMAGVDANNFDRRLTLLKQEYDLQAKMVDLVRQEGDLRRGIVANRIDGLRQTAQSHRDREQVFRRGLRSSEEFIGRLPASERALLPGLMEQFNKGGITAVPEQFRGLVEGALGPEGQRRASKQFREAGRPIAEATGIAAMENAEADKARAAAREASRQIQNQRVTVQVQVERNSRDLVNQLTESLLPIMEKMLAATTKKADRDAEAMRQAGQRAGN